MTYTEYLINAHCNITMHHFNLKQVYGDLIGYSLWVGWTNVIKRTIYLRSEKDPWERYFTG